MDHSGAYTKEVTAAVVAAGLPLERISDIYAHEDWAPLDEDLPNWQNLVGKRVITCRVTIRVTIDENWHSCVCRLIAPDDVATPHLRLVASAFVGVYERHLKKNSVTQ